MGSFLSHPWTEQTTEAGTNQRLEFAVSSMHGWRRFMEDAHSAILDLDKDTSFFGVFDGHRGAEVAQFSALHLHEEMLQSEAYKKGDIPNALLSAFLSLDARLLSIDSCQELQSLGLAAMRRDSAATRAEAAKMGTGSVAAYEARIAEVEEMAKMSQKLQRLSWKGPLAGSVAIVAVVHGALLFVANAGDARAVLCRAGKAVEMSEDHKPTVKAEMERIVAAGGFISSGRVNGGLSLSRALGDMDHKTNPNLPPGRQLISPEPDVRSITLGPEDEFIILACDGIWDVMTSDACVQFLREGLQKGQSPSECVVSLLSSCVAPSLSPKHRGFDNMTALLVIFKQPDNKAPPSPSSSSEPTPGPPIPSMLPQTADSREVPGTLPPPVPPPKAPSTAVSVQESLQLSSTGPVPHPPTSLPGAAAAWPGHKARTGGARLDLVCSNWLMPPRQPGQAYAAAQAFHCALALGAGCQRLSLGVSNKCSPTWSWSDARFGKGLKASLGPGPMLLWHGASGACFTVQRTSEWKSLGRGHGSCGLATASTHHVGRNILAMVTRLNATGAAHPCVTRWSGKSRLKDHSHSQRGRVFFKYATNATRGLVLRPKAALIGRCASPMLLLRTM